MNESRQKRAERFRAAYKAKVDVEIVPSKKDLGLLERGHQELVGPYCRVSTFSEEQVESFETQKAYYEDYVKNFTNWTLVDIYADEGISATSMKNRKDFNRMIEDCKAGKLTRIITKTVSRFARNAVDGLSTVRMLRTLPQPVGVYFETEHIDSLMPESDSQLSLYNSFAESESINKSISMKWAIRSRFGHGIPRLCDTYGFIRDREERQLELDPIDSNVVRYMYELLCDGIKPTGIANMLTSLNIPTPTGKAGDWSPSTVAYILSNEKNCGDVFMQKTITVDVFSHKALKNIGQERMYILRDHHPAIVSRDIWRKSQYILGNISIDSFLQYDQDIVEPLGPDFFLVNCAKGVSNELFDP